MIDAKKKVKVTNRLMGTVVYQDGDHNRRRVFAPGASKQIEFEELEAVANDAGGANILKDYLFIDDPQVVSELFGEVEPEYAYSDADIKRIMEQGTVEEFIDMLNFIPEAGLENIKSLAVSLPLNDVAKRDAILKKTGFDVTFAVNQVKNAKTLEEVERERERSDEPVTPPLRTKEILNGKPQRLAAKPEAPVSKYNVVKRG